MIRICISSVPSEFTQNYTNNKTKKTLPEKLINSPKTRVIVCRILRGVLRANGKYTCRSHATYVRVL